jgi:uncharacterized protein YaaN involved in tellurite resistance
MFHRLRHTVRVIKESRQRAKAQFDALIEDLDRQIAHLNRETEELRLSNERAARRIASLPEPLCNPRTERKRL